jgi:phospholipid transport system transporter-binding protein
VLVLPSELTHAQAQACLQMLVQGLRTQNGSSVMVDASALQHFDSAALAVLLEFRRECLVAGKHFSIRGLSPRLADLAGLYGIAELLTAA